MSVGIKQSVTEITAIITIITITTTITIGEGMIMLDGSKIPARTGNSKGIHTTITHRAVEVTVTVPEQGCGRVLPARSRMQDLTKGDKGTTKRNHRMPEEEVAVEIDKEGKKVNCF